MKRKLEKLSPALKLLIIVLFLAVTGVLYYTLFYTPTIERTASLKSDVEEVQAQIDRENLKREKLNEMEAALADPAFTKQYVAAYNNKILVDVFLSEFTADVELVNNQKIDTSKVAPIAKESEYYVRTISALKFKTGSYESAKAAIQKLYDCEFMTVISDVTITGTLYSNTPCEVSLTVAFFERETK